MNFENFRRTGELSDITIIVDKTQFKLHTFPLFTKSDFFKKAVASTTAPFVIRLENEFPGGAETFNQLADYFYSIPITIDQKNIVPLRSAACFIQCETLEAVLDKRFDEILSLARRKHDLTIPLTLLEQCTGEYEQWTKQTKIVERCLTGLAEALTRGVGLQLNREMFVGLPLEYLIQLIQLCPKESRLAILPMVKHYITIHVLQSNEGGEDKRAIIDGLVRILDENFEQYPLLWLNSLYEKAVELHCESESTLASIITQVLLHSTDVHHGLENIPDDVIARLLERISKHKDEHIKDPQLLSKLSTLIDSYVEQLRQRGTLTSEQFVQLASCIPKENRDSHDSLLLALDEILKDEKSLEMTSTEREELLNQIDFSRVNEETITACKTNKLIPQQLITDAALSVCKKLRKQLDETRQRLQAIENQSTRYRPSYTSSTSKYRTGPTFRSPVRSSTISRSNSIYNPTIDLDYLLPSRYLSSASNSRYGSFSTYRH